MGEIRVYINFTKWHTQLSYIEFAAKTGNLENVMIGANRMRKLFDRVVLRKKNALKRSK